MNKFLFTFCLVLFSLISNGQNRVFKKNDGVTEVAPEKVRQYLRDNPDAIEVFEMAKLTDSIDYPNDIIYTKADSEFKKRMYVYPDLYLICANPDAEFKNRLYEIVEKLDLRAGPGKEYSSLYQLEKGDSVVLVGENGDFYKVLATSKHIQNSALHTDMFELGYVLKKCIKNHINTNSESTTLAAAPATKSSTEIEINDDKIPVEYSTELAAPAEPTFFVNSNNINARSGPSLQSTILFKLNQNDEVIKLTSKGDFCKIQYEGQIAYVASKYLSFNKVPTWERLYISTGETPKCENITPLFSSYHNIQFKIINQLGNDVAFKLMRRSNDECIRFIYIKSGDSYSMYYIPEGNYYYKYASGSDYSQKIDKGICKTRFFKNARYVLGDNTVNLFVTRTSNGYSIPSNQLTLYSVMTPAKFKNDAGTNISPEKFDE
jgi:uncharacterized protein YgiM (DUF1202 family)